MLLQVQENKSRFFRSSQGHGPACHKQLVMLASRQLGANHTLCQLGLQRSTHFVRAKGRVHARKHAILAPPSFGLELSTGLQSKPNMGLATIDIARHEFMHVQGLADGTQVQAARDVTTYLH